MFESATMITLPSVEIRNSLARLDIVGCKIVILPSYRAIMPCIIIAYRGDFVPMWLFLRARISERLFHESLENFCRCKADLYDGL